MSFFDKIMSFIKFADNGQVEVSIIASDGLLRRALHMVG